MMRPYFKVILHIHNYQTFQIDPPSLAGIVTLFNNPGPAGLEVQVRQGQTAETGDPAAGPKQKQDNGHVAHLPH